MTEITPVAVGTEANDGTGDSLRAAFLKINASLAALAAGKAEVGDLGTLVGSVAGLGRYRGVFTMGTSDPQAVLGTTDWDAGDWIVFEGSGYVLWTDALGAWSSASVRDGDILIARDTGADRRLTNVGGTWTFALTQVVNPHDGIILQAPDGGTWKVSVNNDGTLAVVAA